MMRLVKRLLLLETSEQQRIHHGIDVLARSFRPLSPYDAAAMDTAAVESRQAVSRTKTQAHNLLRNMKWAPLDAAALFVMLYCKRQLAAGHHHIYRGVLSGQGQALRRVFDHAVERLVTAGRYTTDEAKALAADLDEQVGEVG